MIKIWEARILRAVCNNCKIFEVITGCFTTFIQKHIPKESLRMYRLFHTLPGKT